MTLQMIDTAPTEENLDDMGITMDEYLDMKILADKSIQSLKDRWKDKNQDEIVQIIGGELIEIISGLTGIYLGLSLDTKKEQLELVTGTKLMPDRKFIITIVEQ